MAPIDRIREWFGGAGAEAEGVTYECISCGATFDTVHESCPECRAGEIRERGGPAGPDTDL
jgi:hypothetical protein